MNHPFALKGGPFGPSFSKEFFFVLSGSVQMEIEDLDKNKKSFLLNSEQGLFIPNFIIHTYKILEDNTMFLVVCNTTYDPSNKETWDTYSREEFEEMQNNKES